RRASFGGRPPLATLEEDSQVFEIHQRAGGSEMFEQVRRLDVLALQLRGELLLLELEAHGPGGLRLDSFQVADRQTADPLGTVACDERWLCSLGEQRQCSRDGGPWQSQAFSDGRC